MVPTWKSYFGVNSVVSEVGHFGGFNRGLISTFQQQGHGRPENMKTRFALFGLASAVMLAGIVGCSRSDTVAEGVICDVEYQLPGGGTDGFTRLNDNRAVPGGSGSWNIDAYGRLTREYLIITRPQDPDLGALVIPASRLVSVQFGDAGIREVNEGKTNPPK